MQLNKRCDGISPLRSQSLFMAFSELQYEFTLHLTVFSPNEMKFHRIAARYCFSDSIELSVSALGSRTSLPKLFTRFVTHIEVNVVP